MCISFGDGCVCVCVCVSNKNTQTHTYPYGAGTVGSGDRVFGVLFSKYVDKIQVVFSIFSEICTSVCYKNHTYAGSSKNQDSLRDARWQLITGIGNVTGVKSLPTTLHLKEAQEESNGNIGINGCPP